MLAADLQIHKYIKLELIKLKINFPFARCEAKVPRLKIFRSEKSSLMNNISNLSCKLYSIVVQLSSATLYH